ncbi:CynX/NimT family MFS transporter [Aquibacillus rhizosphaerae]|uniref:MFS transporter n=1 Tax=Aquibacillus rhizosphaerae TaxID=3051431 RepID=A0ABT7L5H5_9BACI|nr:MFS transporter [Aquibacillus sp. LR5S19]MDL4841122.1 MFS transporter [Aquibacillus sp. LR5S19]
MYKQTKPSIKQIILISGIILVAFNLRPAITSVGPLIGIIRDDLGLANWNAGLITSLPLLAFATMSPLAPKLGNKLGNEKTILAGLLLLFLGIIIRSMAFTPTIYIGTTLVGLGVAICNVLLPGLIKEKFPNNIGLMTAVYTTSMSIFAATASGLSVPLASGLGLGWQKSLISWAILAGIGIMVWLILIKSTTIRIEKNFYEPSAKRLLKSPLAWQVTIFMGFQSFLFYVTISWLPEILHHSGFTISTGGWLLSYMQFVSLPATFLTPILAGRLKNQQIIIYVVGILALIGYTGLLLGGPLALMMVWITLIGFALGSSISLALALLGLRSSNARQAAELSGMAQSFGYLLASVGPIVIGLIYDFTGNWSISIITILVVSLFMIFFGLGASRDKYVLEKP